MELTGKCKEAFEKWYFKNHCKSNIKYKDLAPFQKEEVFGWFYDLNNSFKWSVLVDFFDEKSILITNINTYRSGEWDCEINGQKTHFVETRQEARTESIKKANEIYNSNK